MGLKRVTPPAPSRFLKAFDDPNSQGNLDFWDKVSLYERLESGKTWLSDWITAFMAFDGKGQWTPNSKPRQHSQDSELIIDGISYHFYDGNEIPAGYAQVALSNGRSVKRNIQLHFTDSRISWGENMYAAIKLVLMMAREIQQHPLLDGGESRRRMRK